jgi:hypothetical protein
MVRLLDFTGVLMVVMDLLVEDKIVEVRVVFAFNKAFNVPGA